MSEKAQNVINKPEFANKMTQLISCANSQQLQCEYAYMLTRNTCSPWSNEELRYLLNHDGFNNNDNEIYNSVVIDNQMDNDPRQKWNIGSQCQINIGYLHSESKWVPAQIVDIFTNNEKKGEWIRVVYHNECGESVWKKRKRYSMNIRPSHQSFNGYHFDPLQMYINWCFNNENMYELIQGIHKIYKISKHMETHVFDKILQSHLILRLVSLLTITLNNMSHANIILIRLESAFILLNISNLATNKDEFFDEATICIFKIISQPLCQITVNGYGLLQIQYNNIQISQTKFNSLITLLNGVIKDKCDFRCESNAEILLHTMKCINKLLDTHSLTPGTASHTISLRHNCLYDFLINDKVIKCLLAIYKWGYDALQKELFPVLSNYISCDELRYVREFEPYDKDKMDTIDKIDVKPMTNPKFEQFQCFDIMEFTLNECFQSDIKIIKQAIHYIKTNLCVNGSMCSMYEKLKNSALISRIDQILSNWEYFDWNDLSLQIDALSILSRFHPKECNNISLNKFKLFKPDIIPKLIKLMSSKSNKYNDYNAMKNILCALNDVLSENNKQESGDFNRIAFTNGIINELMKLMYDHKFMGDVFAISLLTTLCNDTLAVTDTYLPQILKTLNMLTGKYENIRSVLEDLCWAYSYLTDNISMDILVRCDDYLKDYDNKQKELLTYGYIRKYVCKIDPEIFDVCSKMYVMNDQYYYYSTQYDYFIHQYNEYVNPLKKIVNLLQHPSECIRIPVLRTIGNVIKTSNGTKYLLEQLDILNKLKFVIKYDASSLLKAEALLQISNIITQSNEYIDHINTDIMRTLIKVLTYESIDVSEEAFYVIYHIIHNASELYIEKLINTFDILSVLFHYIKTINSVTENKEYFDALIDTLESIEKILSIINENKYEVYLNQSQCALILNSNTNVDQIVLTLLNGKMNIFSSTMHEGYSAYE